MKATRFATPDATALLPILWRNKTSHESWLLIGWLKWVWIIEFRRDA